MRSLLAEDGAMIGEAVLDFLHDGGCAVDGVKDGQMA
ncbi:MAG: DNA-binding response regulator, partial [Hylemonella sp.]|nr:DNA-binding response regulator [Hylemonella sp.]